MSLSLSRLVNAQTAINRVVFAANVRAGYLDGYDADVSTEYILSEIAAATVALSQVAADLQAILRIEREPRHPSFKGPVPLP